MAEHESSIQFCQSPCFMLPIFDQSGVAKATVNSAAPVRQKTDIKMTSPRRVNITWQFIQLQKIYTYILAHASIKVKWEKWGSIAHLPTPSCPYLPIPSCQLVHPTSCPPLPIPTFCPPFYSLPTLSCPPYLFPLSKVNMRMFFLVMNCL